MDVTGEVDEVTWLVRGSWVSLCLRAACELGVVDALDEPRDPADLAARTSADPATLVRLLRVLVDLGLLTLDAGRYAVTRHGELLRSGHPSGLRHLALMQSTVPNLTAWTHLADAVRSGAGVYADVNGASTWEWLATHPDEQAVFNAAMARKADQQVEAVLATGVLAGTGLLVDVGGGQGGMVRGLLERLPSLRAVVADRPPVAGAATEALAAAGLGDRGRGEPADFFAGVPAGGDVYTLGNVLHDWTDDEAVAILRTVRAAMRPEATLLVIEGVVDAPGRTREQQRDLHLLDLHMLVLFGARERTRAEYDALLTAAGFAAARLDPSPNAWDVLVSRPAP